MGVLRKSQVERIGTLGSPTCFRLSTITLSVSRLVINHRPDNAENKGAWWVCRLLENVKALRICSLRNKQTFVVAGYEDYCCVEFLYSSFGL